MTTALDTQPGLLTVTTARTQGYRTLSEIAEALADEPTERARLIDTLKRRCNSRQGNPPMYGLPVAIKVPDGVGQSTWMLGPGAVEERAGVVVGVLPPISTAPRATGQDRVPTVTVPTVTVPTVTVPTVTVPATAVALSSPWQADLAALDEQITYSGQRLDRLGTRLDQLTAQLALRQQMLVRLLAINAVERAIIDAVDEGIERASHEEPRGARA